MIRILVCANKGAENYEKAIRAVGGIPVLKYLPDENTDYDGLLLCGGNDIHPEYYGAPNLAAVDFDHQRDKTEYALAKAFLKTGKPIFGICRGHQLLNIALGGSLIQHLPQTDAHRKEDGEVFHEVVAEKNGIFHHLYGDKFRINSFHHQAVERLGEGLRATLWSGDGVIEGFEHQTLPYLGTQFHPERMCLDKRREDTADGLPLFEYFISLCK
jgi:putative glutamine amidotransferase